MPIGPEFIACVKVCIPLKTLLLIMWNARTCKPYTTDLPNLMLPACKLDMEIILTVLGLSLVLEVGQLFHARRKQQVGLGRKTVHQQVFQSNTSQTGSKTGLCVS